MIKELVDAGGAGFLIPAVLFALLVLCVKGVFGLFGHKARARKEFLEHWDSSRVDDDLWLEVTVRHQFGVYLPAWLIRLALSQPHKAQALIEISDIWPLMEFDPAAVRAVWKKKLHDSRRKRVRAYRLVQSGYFALAFGAFGAGWVCYWQPANSFTAWVYGVVALELLVMAAFLPGREEALKTAANVGDAWVARINAQVASNGTFGTGLTLTPNSAAAVLPTQQK